MKNMEEVAKIINTEYLRVVLNEIIMRMDESELTAMQAYADALTSSEGD